VGEWRHSAKIRRANSCTDQNLRVRAGCQRANRDLWVGDPQLAALPLSVAEAAAGAMSPAAGVVAEEGRLQFERRGDNH